MPRTKNPIVIVHGWSDKSDSFKPLANFLQGKGFQTLNLFLADYLSMEDEVTIDDAAKAMQRAVHASVQNGQLTLPFDLIVHSTGGLVSRAWLSTYYTGVAQDKMPVQRLVMLAPANFGSALASVGQTILGRVVKGWGHGFHTGTQMLNGLELGSPFQWELALRDLFNLDNSNAQTIYGADLVWPFVLVGTMAYQHGLRQMVSEHGADGTVRVAAANLNAFGVTLDFTRDNAQTAPGKSANNIKGAPKSATLVPWTSRYGDMRFPLAVMKRRDHASITDPSSKGDDESDQDQQLFQDFLLSALNCSDYAAYQQIGKDWDIHSDSVQDQVGGDNDHHTHFQLNVFVVDEHQKPVTDYMIEFFAANSAQNIDLTKATDDSIGFFHNKLISDIHKNKQNEALRTIYIDRKCLFDLIYDEASGLALDEVRMSISAAAPGENVSYFDRIEGARGEFVVHTKDDLSRWLRRNTTHFLKIVIPREPSNDVFKLKRYP